MSKNCVLAIMPENDIDVAELILDDFEKNNSTYTLIKISQKQFLTSLGYQLLRTREFFKNWKGLRNFSNALSNLNARIILRVRKKKYTKTCNPLRLKEGKKIGSRLVINAVYRFAPKLIITFDRVTLRKAVYAKRKTNINVKLCYLDLNANFDSNELFYNCDSVAVPNESSKEVLLGYNYPAKQVEVVNFFGLLKAKESNAINEKFFSYVLFNADQFSKRQIKAIINMFSEKFKDVKLYVSTNFRSRLYDFISNIPYLKDKPNIEIITNKDSCISRVEYTIINPEYKNFVYTVCNNAIPIVLSTEKIFKSKSAEYYKQNHIAVCVNSCRRLSKIMETILDNMVYTDDVRENINKKINNNLGMSTCEYLLKMADLLDIEQGVVKTIATAKR